MSSHTILFVQPGASQETRTYTDYKTADDCLEVILGHVDSIFPNKGKGENS